jgi:hypothetical protein
MKTLQSIHIVTISSEDRVTGRKISLTAVALTMIMMAILVAAAATTGN